PNFEMSIELPSLPCTLKVTLIFWPGLALSTLPMLKVTPASCVERVATMWAPLMEASYSVSPCGLWQLAHSLSLACGRLTCPAPVAKFTLSWQEPHPLREGAV